MNIIITAGGTSESLDKVRKITNTSTGALGSIIANTFHKSAPLAKIFYVCSKDALKPDFPAEIIIVESVDDLFNALLTLLTNEKIDICIHAMAVSDYYVSKTTDISSFAEALAGNLAETEVGVSSHELFREAVKAAIDDSASFDPNEKIASNHDDLILSLKKTPKVIKMIKKSQPQTLLVGFKLLNNVSQQELINTAYTLLLNNECSFVLANDLSFIDESRHVGFLIKPDKTYIRCNTKEKIALEIVKQTILETGDDFRP